MKNKYINQEKRKWKIGLMTTLVTTSILITSFSISRFTENKTNFNLHNQNLTKASNQTNISQILLNANNLTNKNFKLIDGYDYKVTNFNTLANQTNFLNANLNELSNNYKIDGTLDISTSRTKIYDASTYSFETIKNDEAQSELLRNENQSKIELTNLSFQNNKTKILTIKIIYH
ncbi:hypothetical protein [Mycoplasmoides pirum]|uniref:hypothetical protein n=1 Tax=Mycoplasmoides pirum TaxID=2122 RepID=UPI00047F1A75|nr:hypothetical protein [Mycoplasmoides pirum]